MKKVFLCTSLWMLSLLLVTSCKNAPQSMGSADYKTMEVEYGNCTLSQSYTAVINGRQSVEIRPQVSGIITKVCIAEGAKVHQDQVLFIIDQVPYKAALQTAIANVKSAEAAVATARMTAESKEELCKEKVVMEGDTTVINAAAFKTREGAYLEDLVKRVPGLVYNKKDNSLTYNGQPISEINVNGEAFFSGDKKTALENLPADLISKLKVYDKKSKEEEFTGISSGEKKYVLDLQTKDELNKTWLTNATVGYGNNQKKDFEGQVNYFSKDGDNLSFIAQSTNRYQNSTYKDNINNSDRKSVV